MDSYSDGRKSTLHTKIESVAENGWADFSGHGKLYKAFRDFSGTLSGLYPSVIESNNRVHSQSFLNTQEIGAISNRADAYFKEKEIDDRTNSLMLGIAELAATELLFLRLAKGGSALFRLGDEIENITIEGEGIWAGNRRINQFTGPGLVNCAGCSIAGDATIKGFPASALNHGKTNIIDVLKFFVYEGEGTVLPAFRNQGALARSVEKMGEGSTAIVFGNRGAGQLGHYFNVVVKDGKAQFLDFQKAGSAVMKSKEFESYENFYLINTTGR